MEQAIAEIVQVTSLISDISLASGEQSNGVSQVAEAVAHMDQTTQKNAASIEEMAGAAESLCQQADELVRAVAAFRLQERRDSGAARRSCRPASCAIGGRCASSPAICPGGSAQACTFQGTDSHASQATQARSGGSAAPAQCCQNACGSRCGG